jgi:predicted transcriptional regulator
MDNYIVLYGLVVLIVFIKISWIEYIIMRKNPSNYRKDFVDNTTRREIIFEILHKIYTHPTFSNRNKTSVTENINTIRSVVKEYLKDSESNDENTKHRKS